MSANIFKALYTELCMVLVNKQLSGWQAIGELRNKQPQQTCSNVFLNFHTVLET
jgi:hypothetical protein